MNIEAFRIFDAGKGINISEAVDSEGRTLKHGVVKEESGSGFTFLLKKLAQKKMVEVILVSDAFFHVASLNELLTLCSGSCRRITTIIPKSRLHRLFAMLVQSRTTTLVWWLFSCNNKSSVLFSLYDLSLILMIEIWYIT